MQQLSIFTSLTTARHTRGGGFEGVGPVRKVLNARWWQAKAGTVLFPLPQENTARRKHIIETTVFTARVNSGVN